RLGRRAPHREAGPLAHGHALAAFPRARARRLDRRAQGSRAELPRALGEGGPVTVWLEFEKPVLELEQKIQELRDHAKEHGVGAEREIAELEKKAEGLRREIYSQLTRYQRVQIARHPRRPYALDYIRSCFTGFDELHGDRHFADDPAIVAGLAWLERRAVMVIGQQKGRDTKENLLRRFGMPNPEGYRKALRL